MNSKIPHQWTKSDNKHICLICGIEHYNSLLWLNGKFLLHHNGCKEIKQLPEFTATESNMELTEAKQKFKEKMSMISQTEDSIKYKTMLLEMKIGDAFKF